ncbi:MAG: MarR family winged helix-turn-helix transcriptional regulator [Paracoccaceae bacterium]
MTDFNLDDFLPYQLAELSRRVSRVFETHATATASRWPNGGCWRTSARTRLSRWGEIHVRVGMDKPKVSRAASRLEAAGYVTKAVNPADRRLVELSLTGKGRELIATLAPIASDYQASLMAALGEGAEEFVGTVRTLTGQIAAEEASGQGA